MSKQKIFIYEQGKLQTESNLEHRNMSVGSRQIQSETCEVSKWDVEVEELFSLLRRRRNTFMKMLVMRRWVNRRNRSTVAHAPYIYVDAHTQIHNPYARGLLGFARSERCHVRTGLFPLYCTHTVIRTSMHACVVFDGFRGPINGSELAG